MKTSSSAACAARRRPSSAFAFGGSEPGDLGEPLGLEREAPHEDRDALGDGQVTGAEEPRERPVEADVVRAVAELVQHRVRPEAIGLDVGEDAHVPFAVDVDAERVLGLALAREQVAAVEDRPRVDPDAREGLTGEGDDVLAVEDAAQVDPAGRRDLLEERVLVVPGPKLLDGAAEAVRERGVGGRLPARERVGGEPVALVEGLEEPRLVHLRRRDREGEPVAVAERAGGLVPEACKLAHVLGDRGTDRLRRLPRLAALGDVVARAEDALDLVVVDRAAADLAAVLREPRLDRRVELDDPVPERLRHLLGQETRVEEVELTANEPVRSVRPRLLDLAEEIGVRQRVRERELCLDAATLVLLRGGDVRVPPRQGGGQVQRAEPVDGPGRRRRSDRSSRRGYPRRRPDGSTI